MLSVQVAASYASEQMPPGSLSAATSLNSHYMSSPRPYFWITFCILSFGSRMLLIEPS